MQKKIDFDLASRLGLGYIRNWLPQGKQEGREWVARNPKRSDNNLGSFKVNLSTGKWMDAATGDKGGDSVSLYAYLNGVSQKYAALKILESYGHHAETPPPAPVADEWEPQIPIPENHSQPIFSSNNYGEPSHVAPYETRDGKLAFYVLRWETSEGKTVRPYSYCKNLKTGAFSWRFIRPKGILPLYGIAHALKNKNPIIVVEGEKKRDALKDLLPHYNVVSFCGGSKNVKNADWSALTEREIVIWGDNDEPGRQAAEEIFGILQDSARVRFANIPAGKPDGWDCGDAVKEGYTEADILKIVARPHESREASRFPFRALGYDHGNYYFLSSRSKQVLSYSPSGLTQNALLSLAPLQFWEDEFPSKNGFNLGLAVDTLIGLSQLAGPYDSSRIRGRGAWFDSGRVVLHLGDRLLVDNKTEVLNEFTSNFIYESRPPISTPEITRDGGDVFRVVEILRRLNWENPFFADLLAGWCFIAPICGALQWRPHVWLTGASGSGKSWTMDNVIRPLLGRASYYATGETTAPGIRQHIASDALPVAVDEAEPRNKKELENLQGMLFLARQSSSDGGGMVYKGSQSGRAQSFMMRSAWLFSSIGVAIKDAADGSRITVLGLKPNYGDKSREDFVKLKSDVARLMTPRFTEVFRARAVRMIPTIRENCAVFSEVAARVLNSQRLGDQIGALCGGFWALYSDDPVETSAAEGYLSQHSLDDHAAAGEARDEEICLGGILQSLCRVNSGETFTISEIVAAAIGKGNIGMTPMDADSILRRIGIRAKDGFVFFQNSHPEIQKLLDKTPYSVNYHLILKRIPEAIAGEKIRILSGQKAVRACGVPLRFIFEDGE